jgi:hypothetical protein
VTNKNRFIFGWAHSCVTAAAAAAAAAGTAGATCGTDQAVDE